MPRKTTIYAIYVSEEKELLDTLLHHLKTMITDHDITIWRDEPIISKQRWKPSDESRLGKTDLFLLLVSNAFMYSEFIKQLEFKAIIDSYKAGKSTVIPIILENCPWEIDFEADAYTFSFKELHVLPEEGKFINSWDSADEPLKSSASYIKSVIATLRETEDPVLPVLEEADLATTKVKQAQLALAFSEEMETKRRAEEAQKIKEALAQRYVAEEKRRIEEVELKKRASEALRLQGAAEAKRRAEESTAKREAKEKQKRILEDAKAKSDVKMKATSGSMNTKHTKTQEVPKVEGVNTKKRVLLGVFVATLIILGILVFARNGTKTSETLPAKLKKETIVEKDVREESTVIPKEKPKISTEHAVTSKVALNIGDAFEDGIIFEIDKTGTNGKIAHLEDSGSMTWNNAMKSKEQLGQGWRLPTFNELKLMYKTIGQGTDNSGQFTDELYWSATPYDDNQARVVRFRDGNTSYHYNSKGTHRKFQVRTVRDFSR